MLINQSWKYKIDDNIDFIEVSWDIDVLIIDFNKNWDIKRNINITWWAKVDYRLWFVWENIFNINFELLDKQSDLNISSLSFSKNNEIVDWNLSVNLLSENTYSDTEINAICFDWWVINISGDVYIDYGSYKSEWYLQQRTLFLSDRASSSLTPKLDVACNDVKASHWASISKLDEVTKFYLLTRWLSLSQINELMVSWYITNFLDWTNYDSLKNEFFDYIY